ncbi:hypothetical protein MG293_019796 [Ovis ammon polii]|uniref:Uncharacterized protein n=1 Tax=Ovis ammon polii TaxID=230172 RepID=A0AAD4TQV3_OVIAM|nr:hypothetical protein MG293_019796 [Ovis ammon polii]KAI4553146.1 hypothetical protein MJT46_016440 [Ovis ammon polii x Ovis aries]
MQEDRRYGSRISCPPLAADFLPIDGQTNKNDRFGLTRTSISKASKEAQKQSPIQAVFYIQSLLQRYLIHPDSLWTILSKTHGQLEGDRQRQMLSTARTYAQQLWDLQLPMFSKSNALEHLSSELQINTNNWLLGSPLDKAQEREWAEEESSDLLMPPPSQTHGSPEAASQVEQVLQTSLVATCVLHAGRQKDRTERRKERRERQLQGGQQKKEEMQVTETEILWVLKHVSVDSEAADVSAELRRCGDTGPGVAGLVHSPCISAPHRDEPRGSNQG